MELILIKFQDTNQMVLDLTDSLSIVLKIKFYCKINKFRISKFKRLIVYNKNKHLLVPICKE